MTVCRGHGAEGRAGRRRGVARASVGNARGSVLEYLKAGAKRATGPLCRIGFVKVVLVVAVVHIERCRRPRHSQRRSVG